jgi:hypothetical protein
MKLYKLYLAKSLLVFCFLIPAMWVLAGVIGIIVGAVGKFGSDGPPTGIFVIPLVGGFFLAYMHLRIPFEINVRDDSMIEFRSVFRRTIISPVEIESVCKALCTGVDRCCSPKWTGSSAESNGWLSRFHHYTQIIEPSSQNETLLTAFYLGARSLLGF